MAISINGYIYTSLGHKDSNDSGNDYEMAYKTTLKTRVAVVVLEMLLHMCS